jgi:hypothetical protein
MKLSDQDRREIADKRIASLGRHARAMESEGDYRAAAEATEQAAEWDFWAIHGVGTKEYDEAFAEANDQ